MLILLSSQGEPEAGAGPLGDEADENGNERQVGDGLDDAAEVDERRTTALVEALVLT